MVARSRTLILGAGRVCVCVLAIATTTFSRRWKHLTGFSHVTPKVSVDIAHSSVCVGDHAKEKKQSTQQGNDLDSDSAYMKQYSHERKVYIQQHGLW